MLKRVGNDERTSVERKGKSASFSPPPPLSLSLSLAFSLEIRSQFCHCRGIRAHGPQIAHACNTRSYLAVASKRDQCIRFVIRPVRESRVQPEWYPSAVMSHTDKEELPHASGFLLGIAVRRIIIRIRNPLHLRIMRSATDVGNRLHLGANPASVSELAPVGRSILSVGGRNVEARYRYLELR